MKLCLTDHSALFVLPCLKHTQRCITKQRQTNVAKAFFNETTELDLCSVVTTQGKQNEACKTNCDIVYGSSVIFPPAFFSVTRRNTMADALAACSCFVKIYSQWFVFRQKKKKTDSSLKLSSPALRNDKGESWSSPSLYAFSSVSLMCLSGAVEEQNSKSIKQLVYPSPWLSPGKIYWLQQQPEHTGISSFVVGWISRATQVHGLDTITGHRHAIWRGMEVYSHYPILCQRGLTFFNVSLPTLQLWRLCCGMAAHS